MIQTLEIPFNDPETVFEAFQHHQWAILLDSALPNEHFGRYSYIAFNPFLTLSAKDGDIFLNDTIIQGHNNPLCLLQTLLNDMSEELLPNLPPFQGGVAGAFSYDLHQYFEQIPTHVIDEQAFPDLAVGFYDVIISFDLSLKKAWIISTGFPEKTDEARQQRARVRLNDTLKLINIAPPSNKKIITPKTTVFSNFSPDEYKDAVNRVIDYILAGDIFEANISQCFKTTLPNDCTPYALYLKLRQINPAPFAAFMNLGNTFVISASPERFLKLHEGVVEARPIKGTRRRHPDPEQDQQLANELLKSEKDIAENVMIVDLLRNDLSKVCQDSSVHVMQLCGLESYATVHHLVSVITGALRFDQHPIDLFMAAFPGGSITGAPKIRAMTIIAEIEPTKRGIYCGSMGYIGFNGEMDLSIAIRTITINNKTVTFQTGGAVVVDSDPLEEYQETLTKSIALRQALGAMNDFTH